jgi:hypothetical protein
MAARDGAFGRPAAAEAAGGITEDEWEARGRAAAAEAAAQRRWRR